MEQYKNMKVRTLASLCLISTLYACGGMQVTNSPDKEYPIDTTGEEAQSEDTESEIDNIEDEEEEAVDTGGSAETEVDAPLTDFSQTGPHAVTVQDRTVSVTGCNINYDIYTPQGITDPPTVVLGHGFARGSSVMVGWAEHFSSWGVEVLLPTLCHYNVLTGVDHEMNGQNMKELAALHGSTSTVYAGHSAGGLAAIIAAAQDSGTVGVLGLDATDTEGVPGVDDFIGREYAGDVSCPSFSVMGEPSTCNSNNNGLELFKAMPEYRAIQVMSADHCDFESPTDFVCEMSCEASTAEYSDEEIRPVIVSLATAAIVSLAGVSEDGTLVWADVGISDWIEEGLIQEK